MRRTILEAHNLSVRTGSEFTIKEISFHIYEGELVAFCQTGRNESIISMLLNSKNIRYYGGWRYFGKDVGKRNAIDSFYISSSNMLIESMSVADNLSAIRPQRYFKFYKASHEEAVIRDFWIRTSLPFDIKTPISMLKKAHKYMLLMAKAVLLGKPILVLDNFMKYCNTEDLRWILKFVEKQKKNGTTFIATSNDDSLLVRKSDRIYFCGDNGIIDMLFRDEYSHDMFKRVLLDKDFDSIQKRNSRVDHAKLVMDIQLDRLKKEREILSIYQGEIVGIHDSYGNESDRIYESFFQRFPYYIDGRCCNSYIEAVRNGLSIISVHNEKLYFDSFSVEKNLTLLRLKGISNFGVINRRLENYYVKQYMSKILSGNDGRFEYFERLKLLIYRSLITHPKIMLFDNPYIGADWKQLGIFSKIINEVTQTGCSVLIVSTSDTLCKKVCDRVI